MIRLKELSRNVPYAFELVFCIPTFTPFRLEADIHQHFAAHRIRERACTEFFDIDLKAIEEYPKAGNQCGKRPPLKIQLVYIS